MRMSEPCDGDHFGWGVVIVILVVVLVFSNLNSRSEGMSLCQRDAIRNGAAHYEPDERGAAKFTWNAKPPEKP